jgi:hypothetical protein
VALPKVRAIVLGMLLVIALICAGAAGAAAATLSAASTLVGLGGLCSFPAVFVVGSGLCPSLREGGSASGDFTNFGTMQVMEATAGPCAGFAARQRSSTTHSAALRQPAGCQNTPPRKGTPWPKEPLPTS